MRNPTIPIIGSNITGISTIVENSNVINSLNVISLPHFLNYPNKDFNSSRSFLGFSTNVNGTFTGGF